MGFFADILGAAASAIKTVIRVSADVASTAVRVVRIKYRELKERYRDIDVSERKKERFEELKEVNDELIELEQKFRRDGQLNESDQQRVDALYNSRNKLRTKVETAKEYEALADIDQHGEKYSSMIVDPLNPNEITRLGGQVVMGKICARCQRPMAIRWRSAILNPSASDLFWGCTGFFVRDANQIPACRNSEPFSIQDRQIFGNIQRPGMELPAQRLTEIVLSPEISQQIKNRLRNAVNEMTDDYLCPIHHERMALKTKNNPADILDLYYLKCNRCEQSVKIKSPTQLDAVLESFSDKGLF